MGYSIFLGDVWPVVCCVGTCREKGHSERKRGKEFDISKRETINVVTELSLYALQILEYSDVRCCVGCKAVLRIKPRVRVHDKLWIVEISTRLAEHHPSFSTALKEEGSIPIPPTSPDRWGKPKDMPKDMSKDIIDDV